MKTLVESVAGGERSRVSLPRDVVLGFGGGEARLCEVEHEVRVEVGVDDEAKAVGERKR